MDAANSLTDKAKADAFYAHISEDGRKQTVEAHLLGTAKLCSEFAARFGEAQRGYLLGYAHDIGKYSDAFQHRLDGGPKVDHATAGALACCRANEVFAAGCIAGHHGGLPDFGNFRSDPPDTPTLAGRLQRGSLGQIPPCEWSGSLPEAGTDPQFRDLYTRALWTKMLYSCLVDADYLDTEAFMNGTPAKRGNYDTLPVLLERLNQYISPWFPPKTELNQNRCRILSQCLDMAAQPQGIYSLTVPTGGGKTVSSLAFALKHAVTHGMDRVIYVIPYTSIIEQNAAVFRTILGEDNVVEHHSHIGTDGDEESSEQNMRNRLAAENWDAPVIVTTAVQFFESLYASKASRCRKLHNIANSVVIFDEAQMLPAGHLLPCVGAIANLAAHFHTTAVLCTATQPVLSDMISTFSPGLTLREICPDAATLYQAFRRVTYRNAGKLTLDSLCGQLKEQSQVLCIVNTRKSAQDIFRALPEDGSFHLSTLMYPAHRTKILSDIRDRLRSGKTCRVVSTSLIEAGVDIDFPAVYRELAGLDSIAQAAGRCNREGRRPAQDSIVTYFEGETPAPVLQQIQIGATREALVGERDPGNPDTIRRYFSSWRSLIGEQTDKSGAVEHLRKGIRGCLLPFRTVSEAFRFIDQDTRTVYIPMGDGAALCRKLRDGSAESSDWRKAGQYAVSIYARHYTALWEAGAIYSLDDSSAVLLDLQLYDEHSGLSLEFDTGKAEFV